MKRYALFFLFISGHEFLFSQISSYSSISYGNHSNPLYNYQNISDQLLQTYLELNSDHDDGDSRLQFQYAGGSVIFNRFTLRNYYEHHIAAIFDAQYSPASTSDDTEEEEEETVNEIQEDSTGVYFHSGVQLMARHDKKEFREFDNSGISVNNSFRFTFSNGFVGKVTNTAEYHNYQYLLQYNNVSEIFTLSLENSIQNQFRHGVFLSGGLKYFPNIQYDPALFEENRSYVIQSLLDSILVGTGKQRHWEYYTYPDTSESEKILLKKPGTKTTYQAAFGGFLQYSVNEIVMRAEAVYRINSKSTLLTLVQNLSSLTLNEDLYNSVFNAHGPELHAFVKFPLPMEIQLTTQIDLENKSFETPATDLVTGDIVNPNREDRSANLEVYISKFFQITEHFSVDITFGTNILRNQSNDAYNDYSLVSYAVSFGCGL